MTRATKSAKYDLHRPARKAINLSRTCTPKSIEPAVIGGLFLSLAFLS